MVKHHICGHVVISGMMSSECVQSRHPTRSDRGLSKFSSVNCLSQLKLTVLIVVKQSLIPLGPVCPASLMKGALASLLLWKEKDAFSSLAVALHMSTAPLPPKLPSHERHQCSPHRTDS